MQDFGRLSLIGRSPAFLRCLDRIEKCAACDATVLVQGETGTGKELAARAIHYVGTRRDFPFIPVNCGAVPDNLVENEFFGHVKGAFTDARENHAGFVADAEGGTLFLDEIEALSPKAQVVLLRFLQDHTYRPLGGRGLLSSNVRIIAASNADVAKLVEAGSFRQDLMYRLAIMSVTMPALRDRSGDVVLLAHHFLDRCAKRYGRAPKRLDPQSIAALQAYAWPGNARELENLIHREFLLADGDEIRIRGLGADTTVDQTSSPAPDGLPVDIGLRRAKALMIENFERDFLRRALIESGGNVSAAARRVGKERRAFGKLLKKYGIQVGAGARGDGAASP